MKVRSLGAAALAAVFVLNGVTVNAAVTKEDRRRARWAASYVVGTQNPDGSFGFGSVGATADGIVALALAKRGGDAIDDAFAFIATQDVSSLGDIAKVTQALIATGRDPHDYQGRDLVQEMLDSEQPDGRYGESSTVFSHALVMLALAAAGAETGTEPTVWLGEAQCDDGGWQFDEPSDDDDNKRCLSKSDPSNDFSTSDTNTTAMAQMALVVSPGVYPGVDPFEFFRKMRDKAGRGWGYDRTFNVTDANSTALVLQAYVASGKPLPDGAEKALSRLQYDKCSPKGPGFAFTYDDADEDGVLEKKERTGPDAYATIGAIPGLLEAPWPYPAAAAIRDDAPLGC